MTDAPELPPVELIDGIPHVTTEPNELDRAIESLLSGSGPLGVDAERASGFRYGQRAYLVQFHRRGGGTWLIDPIALPDLRSLRDALSETVWILHAASQDVPCLREVGLQPPEIFDTEMAARLLGRERVGLGPLVEFELGLHLAKGHGAADWSQRPIPDDWRRYAALDVEVLPDLYERILPELVAAGKEQWEREESEAVRTASPPPAREDPWRRTSGLHKVRGKRDLATVRSLWWSRDELAQLRDTSPGRILPDAALVAAVNAHPPDMAALAALPEFRRRGAARNLSRWWRAIEDARGLPELELPDTSLPSDGPPPPRLWRDKDPAAADRLDRTKAALAQLSETHNVPVENLITPDYVRRLAWRPPEPLTEATVEAALSERGARAWQIQMVSGPLLGALAGSGPD